MPDSVKVVAATGDDTVAPPIATDLIGGQHYQRIKIGWGADDTWTEVDNAVGKRVPVNLPPASTVSNAASGTADTQIVAAASGLRLLGVSVKEDAGTPALAEFILRLGTSTAGTPITHYRLGPGESVRDWFGPNGIDVAAGIFLDRISGTTDVTVHTVVAA